MVCFARHTFTITPTAVFHLPEVFQARHDTRGSRVMEAVLRLFVQALPEKLPRGLRPTVTKNADSSWRKFTKDDARR